MHVCLSICVFIFLRFSTFVKSGGEAFLLGETKARAAGGEEVALFVSNNLEDPFSKCCGTCSS